MQPFKPLTLQILARFKTEIKLPFYTVSNSTNNDPVVLGHAGSPRQNGSWIRYLA